MCPTFRQTFVVTHFVCKMYTKCIASYKVFIYKIYLTFRQTFAYKMYTKRLYTKFVPNFDKLLHTFSHTKFSWDSSFDFVYKMYTQVYRNVVYILNTCCIHFVYIHCIATSCSYNFCITM